jgi:hypothetical protein
MAKWLHGSYATSMRKAEVIAHLKMTCKRIRVGDVQDDGKSDSNSQVDQNSSEIRSRIFNHWAMMR